MLPRALARLAGTSGSFLLGLLAVLAMPACSSDGDRRDQSYGTNLARDYRFPDGGYRADGASPRDAGAPVDGDPDEDAGEESED